MNKTTWINLPNIWIILPDSERSKTSKKLNINGLKIIRNNYSVDFLLLSYMEVCL
jgi:hypothetical protein